MSPPLHKSFESKAYFQLIFSIPPNLLAGLFVYIPLRSASREVDAVSSVTRSSAEASLVPALRQEIEFHALQETIDAPFTTAYVAGKWVSLPSLEVLDSLLNTLAEAHDSSELEEVTIELSPVDASLEDLKTLQRLGINRVSVKALSFVPQDLKAVDASQTVTDVRQTLRNVRKAGLESFSIDLAFGGREHPLSHWKASLHRAVDLGVPHITMHELRPSESVDDEARAERLVFAMTFLRAKGYEQYELTHFARPGHRSRHQEHYYAHGNYLGLGPGAESFWWPNRSTSTTAQRWSNVEAPKTFAKRLARGKSPVAEQHRLDQNDLAREYILLRLRTKEGLDLKVLESQYGVDLRSYCPSTLDRLRAEGLIYDNPQRVQLTERGVLMTDAITRRLLP